MCRKFYRAFTGFEENSFNSFVAFVENYALEGREYSPYDKYFRSDGLMWHLCGLHRMHLPAARDNLKNQFSKPSKKAQMKDNVMAFLDVQFKRSDTDSSADKNTVKQTRYDWDEIYSVYKEHCDKLSVTACPYNHFCALR